jgi:hypothetical protein
MVHNEKTNVSIKGHERELACAVIINDAGYLVGKRSETENVGNRMVINIVDNVEMGVAIGEVIVFVVVEGFKEARHHGVRDRGRDTNARPFWSGTLKPFTWSFHVAFGRSWAWWKIFGEGLLGEMGSTAEETLLDRGKQGCLGGVAQALVHKFDINFFVVR